MPAGSDKVVRGLGVALPCQGLEHSRATARFPLACMGGWAVSVDWAKKWAGFELIAQADGSCGSATTKTRTTDYGIVNEEG